jgi:hypothetical protein
MRTHRSSLRSIAAALLLVVAPVVVASPADAGASVTCPVVYWGSLLKQDPAMTTDPLVNVRVGEHTCYDRIVFDLGSSYSHPGYSVSYVDNVPAEGTGNPLPIVAGASIWISLHAPAYNAVGDGSPTYVPADPNRIVDVTGFRTFVQVAWGGSFEGYTTVGLGVRARLPMRVFTLAGPGGYQRLVIDVAHRWGSF